MKGGEFAQLVFQEANAGQERVEDHIALADQARDRIGQRGAGGGFLEVMSADAIQFLGQVVQGMVAGSSMVAYSDSGSAEDIREGHGFAGVG